ncbi:MAG: hypothetical protein AB7R40_23695 [Nitrospiraceae bacterium]
MGEWLYFESRCEEYFSALKAIAEFPVTDPRNQDAANMAAMAMTALQGYWPAAQRDMQESGDED